MITTGVPSSLVYERVRYFLKRFSKSSTSSIDTRFTNYEALMDINEQLFTVQNHSSSTEQPSMSPTQQCCHGLTTRHIYEGDLLDAPELRKTIRDFLNPSANANVEGVDSKGQTESWVLFYGSACLEPRFLNVFVELANDKSGLIDFTLNILCFLVNEQQLFENWLQQNLSLEDYQENTYPQYERSMKTFFELLNSSKYLQQSTLLIKEDSMVTDDALLTLIRNIFHQESSKYRANNELLRRSMSTLLSPRVRTVRDIRNVRQNLQGGYFAIISKRLKPLLDELKQPDTAANAARQIVNIVLNEFERTNEEELRTYKRLLMIGFKSTDAQNSNTITAQLVLYALRLLHENNASSIPLIYSIVVSVCVLAGHFYFRHELFNNTVEIYTLSLLLISKRQYALTLAGLRLCVTILRGDQNEHKYAIAYLTHDPLAARKVLDSIKWLLSPFIALKQTWKEESEKKTDENETVKYVYVTFLWKGLLFCNICLV